MIRLCGDNIPLPLRPTVCNARIHTLRGAYQGLRDSPLCYVAGDALLAVSQGLLLLDGPAPDREELWSFAQMSGCRLLLCEEPAARRLGLVNGAAAGLVMCYQGGRPPHPANWVVEQQPRLQEVYDLLRTVFPEMANVPFADWYPDVALKIRRGYAQVCAIYHGGRLAATAGIYHQNAATAVLGAVATARQFRGQGMARALFGCLIERASSEGRRPQLVALTPYAQGLYKSLGFVAAGGFYQIAVRPPVG